MQKHLLLFLFLALAANPSMSQNQNVNKVDNPQMLSHGERRLIQLPMVDDLMPLKCDFHLHTVYSDGAVWPTIRVDEAWRDGLDAIAITDHIEYRPKAKYTVGDLNTSYNIAREAVGDKDLLLVKGTEITRGKPDGGHVNALFITDANKLEDKDMQVQIDRAVAQNAYLIWNHPGWAIDTCKMFKPNEKWIKEGKIQAVEVFNEQEYYPRVSTWVRDLGLAPMACSDAHAPIQMIYNQGISRPITIVFAKDKTLPALREALDARRTVAWFNNQMVGSATWLEKLFRACVSIDKANKAYQLTNASDVIFCILVNGRSVILPARTTIIVGLSKEQKIEDPLSIEISNLHTSENTNLQITI
ncbi:MAG: hypothetical protein RR980_01520 [Mucinivorans sp.]